MSLGRNITTTLCQDIYKQGKEERKEKKGKKTPCQDLSSAGRWELLMGKEGGIEERKKRKILGGNIIYMFRKKKILGRNIIYTFSISCTLKWSKRCRKKAQGLYIDHYSDKDKVNGKDKDNISIDKDMIKIWIIFPKKRVR